jgi:phosphoglycerate dehydrogenase-like enzyme
VEPLTNPLRIALLDVARPQADRLTRLLGFPHTFVTPSSQQQAVDAVIALRFGSAEAIQFLPRLVHLPGAGADAVDFAALPPDCVVCNVFEHEVPVAEFIVAALLDHAIGYSRMVKEFDSEKWSEIYSARRIHGELYGKVVGLIGYGHIGQAVTQRVRAFGMKVHVVSQSGRAPEADWAASVANLPELLRVADFIIVACPLTPATHNLLGAEEFRLMKPSTVLINIGRAQIINEEALFNALETKQIAGATLDVWYQYPVAGDLQARPSRFPFERLPNCHCTPHSSGMTEGLFQRRYAVIADNLTRLRAGQALRNVIHGTNPTAAG